MYTTIHSSLKPTLVDLREPFMISFFCLAWKALIRSANNSYQLIYWLFYLHVTDVFSPWNDNAPYKFPKSNIMYSNCLFSEKKKLRSNVLYWYHTGTLNTKTNTTTIIINSSNLCVCLWRVILHRILATIQLLTFFQLCASTNTLQSYMSRLYTSILKVIENWDIGQLYI